MSQLAPPIFLVGCPRSGTTLLASYMGRHPDLHALPETQYFPGSYGGAFWSRMAAVRNPDSLFDFVWNRNVRLLDLELNAEALQADFRARNINSIDKAFKLVMEHSLKGTGKNRVVEKTPRHLEYVTQIREWFPDAPVICLLRDGRDTVNSLLDARWTHNNADRHISYWRWCVRRALRLQNRYPDRFRIVRFEDFITDPESILRDICQAADLPFSADMMDMSQTVRTAPEWEADWKTKATQAADRAVLYKWQNHPDQDKMRRWSATMHHELELLDYPHDDAIAAHRPQALSFLKLNAQYTFRHVYQTHLSYRANRFRRRQLDATKSS